MSSYFKVGTERNKSNGFIKGLMRCKNQMQMLNHFERHPKQMVLDDVKYYKDKYDINLPENAGLKKMIDKLDAMLA